MSEIPQSLPKEISRVVEEAKRESMIWLHQQDRERQAAAESLDGLPGAVLDQIRPDLMPKILEVTVGERQYVSIRRVDLNSMKMEVATEGKDIFTANNNIFVPAGLLQNEETIGILVSPQIFGAEPKSQDIVDFINDKTEYNDDWAGYCKLQFFLEGGGRFDLTKWSFANSPLDVAVATMRGNRFWIPDDLIWAKDRQTGRTIAGVKQVKPDQSGLLSLPFHSMFWSRADSEAQVEIDKEYGRLYVAVCGSSEKERKREPLKKLTPQETPSV